MLDHDHKGFITVDDLMRILYGSRSVSSIKSSCLPIVSDSIPNRGHMHSVSTQLSMHEDKSIVCVRNHSSGGSGSYGAR